MCAGPGRRAGLGEPARETGIVRETWGVGVPLGSWGLGSSQKILGVVDVQDITEGRERSKAGK